MGFAETLFFCIKNRSKRYKACSDVAMPNRRNIRAAGASRKKVVATVSRCERVYKRTGEPSVPFAKEEERRRV